MDNDKTNMDAVKTSDMQKEPPMKWKKHLVLVRWKLRQIEDLNQSIKRFSVQEYTELKNDLKNELSMTENETTIIVKFVYPDLFIKLPNHIITSMQDIEVLDSIMYGPIGRNVSELWYCKNDQNGIARTLFGRLLISNNPLFPRSPIHYDLVWSSTARVIEKYPNIVVPYASVDRDNWNGDLKFVEIICGDAGENFIIENAAKVIQRVSAYTNEIIDFASYAFSAGCNQLCIEFSMSNNDFCFIDWDSDNDISIINSNIADV